LSANCKYSIAGASYGLAIGLKSNVTNDGDLLAYILFGFGLFTSLISALGLAGVMKQNREYIRVYSGTMAVIFVVEVVVGTFLFRGVPFLKEHASSGLFAIILPIVIHLSSVLLACWVQNSLEDSGDYEPLTSPSLV